MLRCSTASSARPRLVWLFATQGQTVPTQRVEVYLSPGQAITVRRVLALVVLPIPARPTEAWPTSRLMETLPAAILKKCSSMVAHWPHRAVPRELTFGSSTLELSPRRLAGSMVG